MHNLHLITIRADTPKDACNELENEIVEWGNENNWRTICGSISEDNEIYIHDKEYGRFTPAKNMKISDVGKMIKGWVGSFGYNPTEALFKFHMDQQTLSSQDWWLLGEYCDFKQHQIDFYREKFNIWETEYRSWELDENGLTSLIRQNEGKKRFVIFLDMHS